MTNHFLTVKLLIRFFISQVSASLCGVWWWRVVMVGSQTDWGVKKRQT